MKYSSTEPDSGGKENFSLFMQLNVCLDQCNFMLTQTSMTVALDYGIFFWTLGVDFYSGIGYFFLLVSLQISLLGEGVPG